MAVKTVFECEIGGNELEVFENIKDNISFAIKEEGEYHPVVVSITKEDAVLIIDIIKNIING